MRRRISPSMAVACAALLFSLTGAGFAASRYLITSRSQIAPWVRATLRGAQGPRGVPGPPGSAGTRGPAGPMGAAGDPGTSAGGSAAPLTFGSGPESVPAHQQTSMSAKCPSDQAVSGGYEVDPGLVVLADQPVTRDEGEPYPRSVGWTITVENPTDLPLHATVNVDCAF